MDYGHSIEQVFVQRRSGQTELLWVLNSPSGATRKEHMRYATMDNKEAVQRAAGYLARRGDVDQARGLRLRVERQGALIDERSLQQLFVKTFEDVQDEIFESY